MSSSSAGPRLVYKHRRKSSSKSIACLPINNTFCHLLMLRVRNETTKIRPIHKGEAYLSTRVGDDRTIYLVYLCFAALGLGEDRRSCALIVFSVLMDFSPPYLFKEYFVNTNFMSIYLFVVLIFFSYITFLFHRHHHHLCKHICSARQSTVSSLL